MRWGESEGGGVGAGAARRARDCPAASEASGKGPRRTHHRLAALHALQLLKKLLLAKRPRL